MGVCLIVASDFIPVRLVDGSSAHEGRVEIYHSGQWGTICDDQWDDADAEVVCRQLGLGGVAKAWSQAYFGEGSGPVLLDEVRCTGNELSIEQCLKSSWQEHNCGHKEDAGVSCTPLADGAIRLAGGKGNHEGRLEVLYNGQWGTICDDGWTELNTHVVCRQLGFKNGRSSSERYIEEARGPIWLDDVSCSGKESAILQCSKREWGRHDCSHQEDVRLSCYPDNDNHRISLATSRRLPSEAAQRPPAAAGVVRCLCRHHNRHLLLLRLLGGLQDGPMPCGLSTAALLTATTPASPTQTPASPFPIRLLRPVPPFPARLLWQPGGERPAEVSTAVAAALGDAGSGPHTSKNKLF
ncbi:UNVERIFIED_CONTAM: Neurotrypsin [Gekko kuhli]